MKEKKPWFEQIKHHRQKEKLTMREVAESSGISLRHYQFIEAGSKWPSFRVLKAICNKIKLEAIYI